MSHKFNNTATHFWFYEHIWSHNAAHLYHLSCWFLRMDQHVLISDIRSSCAHVSGLWIEYKRSELCSRQWSVNRIQKLSPYLQREVGCVVENAMKLCELQFSKTADERTKFRVTVLFSKCSCIWISLILMIS